MPARGSHFDRLAEARLFFGHLPTLLARPRARKRQIAKRPEGLWPTRGVFCQSDLERSRSAFGPASTLPAQEAARKHYLPPACAHPRHSVRFTCSFRCPLP